MDTLRNTQSMVQQRVLLPALRTEYNCFTEWRMRGPRRGTVYGQSGSRTQSTSEQFHLFSRRRAQEFNAIAQP